MTIQQRTREATIGGLRVPSAPAVIDAGRWPDVVRVPAGPRARVAGAITRRLLGAAADRLGLTVATPDRPIAGADIVLHRPEAFYARIGTLGLIGFGESYLAGDWDADDLGDTLTTLCTRVDRLVPRWMQWLRATYVARPPGSERNTTTNTRGNVARHYDLSNDLFATFLDRTMSYSSALFDHVGQDLGDAQAAKTERILDEAGVGPGTRLLEIGTGWGELAIRAAARGATVRSVTLSAEQQRLARERIATAGHADAVAVDLLDYREIEGEYDAVVSVEMVEAVGHQYWSTYFEKLDRLLAPGGVAVIQAITMPHQRMLATRGTWTWINKYIFPGGFLPSTEAIEQLTRDRTALRVVRRLTFGRHYAETLRRWDMAFLAAQDRVRALGFDDVFCRMWHFYLGYSRAGFAAGYIDVQQITLKRETR